MTEAVNLFQGICSEKHFERSSIILFLNKKDLFAEKLTVSVLVVLLGRSSTPRAPTFLWPLASSHAIAASFGFANPVAKLLF